MGADAALEEVLLDAPLEREVGAFGDGVIGGDGFEQRGLVAVAEFGGFIGAAGDGVSERAEAVEHGGFEAGAVGAPEQGLGAGDVGEQGGGFGGAALGFGQAGLGFGGGSAGLGDLVGVVAGDPVGRVAAALAVVEALEQFEDGAGEGLAGGGGEAVDGGEQEQASGGDAEFGGDGRAAGAAGEDRHRGRAGGIGVEHGAVADAAGERVEEAGGGVALVGGLDVHAVGGAQLGPAEGVLGAFGRGQEGVALEAGQTGDCGMGQILMGEGEDRAAALDEGAQLGPALFEQFGEAVGGGGGAGVADGAAVGGLVAAGAGGDGLDLVGEGLHVDHAGVVVEERGGVGDAVVVDVAVGDRAADGDDAHGGALRGLGGSGCECIAGLRGSRGGGGISGRVDGRRPLAIRWGWPC